MDAGGMKTLREFLHEYEECGGTYPVRVTFRGIVVSAWLDIIASPRGPGGVLAYTDSDQPAIWSSPEKKDWRLWTPPKQSRKEKRYALVDSHGRLFLYDSDHAGDGMRRAPWLDGTIESEE